MIGIGDKVVCVDDNWTVSEGESLVYPGPKKGDVVTVVRVEEYNSHQNGPSLYYHLKEFNPRSYWYALSFRPVQTTNIRIFTEMDRKIFSKQPVEA